MFKTANELKNMTTKEIATYIHNLEQNHPVAKANGDEYQQWCAELDDFIGEEKADEVFEELKKS